MPPPPDFDPDSTPSLSALPRRPEPLAPGLEAPANCTELFLVFTGLALQGFGGVLAVAQRVLCEQRRWLTKAQYLEMLSIGQVLPGPNVCNIALMVGDRFLGTRGAFSALGGMMAVPLVLVMALAILYTHFSQYAMVAGALRGMGAVASGLIFATAFKLAPTLKRSPMGLWPCVAIALASATAIGLLRWPLVWVLLGLGSLGMLLAWRRLRAADAGSAS